MALAAQPLVLNGLITPDQSSQSPAISLPQQQADYIVVGGWTLLKSDLLTDES
ncbi:MAG TPA: hypothetical protein PL131_10780 [Methylotenera sp.]|nr:hypothetical protein [Methylotenera sp.]HPH06349.1 hypothetical protein [Methylotenera sp.]